MISIKVINNLVYKNDAVAATKFEGYSDSKISDLIQLSVDDPIKFKEWLSNESRSKISHITNTKLLQIIDSIDYSKLSHDQHTKLKHLRRGQFKDDAKAALIFEEIKKCEDISIYNDLLQPEFQPNKTSLYMARVNLIPKNVSYIIKQLDITDYAYFTYGDTPKTLKDDLWMVCIPKKPLFLDPDNSKSVSEVEIYIKLDVEDANNKIYVMSIHGQVENTLMQKLRKEGKAKENIFNSTSIPNLATLIRNSGRTYNLNIGYIEIDNPDTNNIQGLFTLLLSTFDVPISVVIDETVHRYNLSDLYDILYCIQSNFELFDIVTGDVDADLVDIYLGGDIITLNCKSFDGQDFEYWTHKSYEKGLPYIISSFARDLHMLATL